MSIPRIQSSSTRPALRLAGLLVVLGGLFGMHGLADHGTGGMELVPHALMSEMAMPPHSSDRDTASTSLVDHAKVPAQAEIAASDPGDPGMDMTMDAMCVAILAIGLLALVRLLLSSRMGPVLWIHPRPARVLARPGRGPDPPSLFALSIQRC